MNNINKIKLPQIWQFYFFIVISLIHISIVFYSFIINKYIFILFIEFLFYLIFSKFNFKRLLNFFFILSIIFILNILFNEGKIIFEFNWIKITENGLKIGVEKISLLFLLFVLSYNIFFYNKDFIFSFFKEKNNIIGKSFVYFFSFFDIIGKNFNIKKIIIKIILIYKKNSISNNNVIYNNKIFYKNIIFVLYNLIVLLNSLFINI